MKKFPFAGNIQYPTIAVSKNRFQKSAREFSLSPVISALNKLVAIGQREFFINHQLINRKRFGKFSGKEAFSKTAIFPKRQLSAQSISCAIKRNLRV